MGWPRTNRDTHTCTHGVDVSAGIENAVFPFLAAITHTVCHTHTYTHFIPTFHRISIVVHVQRLEKQHTRACMTISHTYLVLFSLTYTAYLFLPPPTPPPRLLSPPLSSFLTLFTRVFFLPRTLVPPHTWTRSLPRTSLTLTPF